ncbi:clostripain-related cysteine peptidase [Oceanirhabdus seepicola]|uniref:Uncharacterized protein n=1 Tax=Oceanirhabdus seepicola TaxID=2828781 RepID=A0A9J6P097_9CLOT|nr:clostripain-related cysteine peptidase [Oceanirhabdus seepicola]MCM1989293.1 hypothetical protein [Oceanirhabdus seepicola]
MNRKNKKNWTILIYADGNNELEPEIWKSKIDAEKVGSSDNINVVMQIARESRELAKIIRPNEIIPENDEEWVGVRRYYIMNTKSKLIKDLGKLNMADPHNLYDFIKWGMENYEAKHYMVVLASHGASFIAALSDLSMDAPYMMGVPQMCKALNMILEDVGHNIDILVMDMCYMNSIEIMYELGKKTKNTVKNVLTYISEGPISGLPYERLIDSIEEYSTTDDSLAIIRKIIDSIEMDLVAIEINHGKLKKIKNKVNSLAYCYLSNQGYKKKNPYELINSLDSSDPWYQYVIDVKESFEKIIINYKRISNNANNILNITTHEMFFSNKNIAYIVLIYYSLSFGKNNYWLNVITSKSLKLNQNIERVNTQVRLKPFVLHPTGLLSEIHAINIDLTKDELEKILNKLFVFKGWNYNEIEMKSKNQVKNLSKLNSYS